MGAMALGDLMGPVEKRGAALRSIHHPEARVSVLYQEGDLEVMAVEVESGASLVEPSLWVGQSWHLVIEGQAIFQQRDQRWELLPQESLLLRATAPYTIGNPTPERLRVFTLLFKHEDLAQSSGEVQAHSGSWQGQASTPASELSR